MEGTSPFDLSFANILLYNQATIKSKRDRKGKVLTIANVILAVLAAGLGYLIFRDYDVGSKINSYLKSKPQEVKQENKISNALQSELASEGEDVLNFPSPDANEEERNRHSDLVNKLAIKTDFLEIADCEPSPLVIRLNEEARFIIKNTGDKRRLIQIVDFEIRLPPGSEEEVEVKSIAEFGLGSYGYTCDGVLVGVINVIPNIPQN